MAAILMIMRRLQITIHLLFISLAAAGSACAADLLIDQSQSELSATMHASPSHNFTSVAKDFDCEIQIDPKTLKVSSATCSFKFKDLDSDKSSRDEKMCKWMNIEKYPTARFELLKQLPDNDAGEHVAEGTFTMHGKTRPITLTYTLRSEGERIQLDGHCEINHENWGLDQVRLLFFSVDPLLKPKFHLVGSLIK